MDIYVQNDGEKQGPFSEGQVRHGIDAGELKPEDLAWTTGKASWQPLSDLIELDVTQPPPIAVSSSEEKSPLTLTTNKPNDARPPEFPHHTASAKNRLVVAQTGEADHATINAAIAAAPPGATILVKEGTYEETLLVTKPVTIEAEKRGTVIIHHPKFPVLKIENTEAILTGLSLGIHYAEHSIVIERAKVHMLECDIKVMHNYMMDLEFISADYLKDVGEAEYVPMTVLDADPSRKTSKYCIDSEFSPPFKIDAGSEATVSDCSISNTFIVVEHAVVKMHNCELHHCGVLIQNESKVEVLGGHCHSNRFNNPSFTCIASYLMMAGTNFSDIYAAAVVSAEKGVLWMTGCTISGTSQDHGSVKDDLPGLSFRIPGPTTYSSWHSFGVLALATADVTLLSTTVSSFRRGVFEFSHVGRFQIKDSKLVNNLIGIESQESKKLTVTNSELADNKEYGLTMYSANYDAGYLEITDCKINRNRKFGVSISGCKGKIVDCEFADNGENIYCSPEFPLANIVGCKGVDIQKIGTRFQRVKRLLGWR